MNIDDINRTLETKIKYVFKTALRCIEIKFGNEFNGYDQMRSEILRVGNNAIRELKEFICDELGEDRPEVITRVNVKRRG